MIPASDIDRRPATVTTTDADGNVLDVAECMHDNYVIVCGPDCEVAAEQHWANGTAQLTIKRNRP